jgi:hypothetical protein
MADKIDPETKEGLTPAEVKAAEKNPAGDTVRSGAAPGAKAGDAPTVAETLEKPKAQETAEKRALKVADEVREMQEDVQRKNLLSNVPDFPIVTAMANRDENGKPTGSIVFGVVAGELVVTTTGRELRFGVEEAAGLQRAANRVAGAL